MANTSTFCRQWVGLHSSMGRIARLNKSMGIAERPPGYLREVYQDVGCGVVMGGISACRECRLVPIFRCYGPPPA
jgi:hypothetical protein